MSLNPKPRLAVLGLDGLSLTTARALAERGMAPNLAALIPRATAMRAELPELSPVNWTSLATAAGPGEHGVFGFTRMDPASYQLSVTDSTAVACPTIFDRLGRAGLTSRVLNLPNTYPARPIQGMMVAGFVAKDLDRAVHPKPLAGMLRSIEYRLEADTAAALADPAYLPAELSTVLEGRLRALDLLWNDLAWDLFVCVFTETDRLFHFLHPAVLDETHPLHAPVAAFMRRWDAAVGIFLERFAALPEPKALMVLADHGFTDLITEVDINAWLRGQGLLRLAGKPAHELDASVIAPESAAFALDPGRVYLHDARFARGRLEQARTGDMRQRIANGLMALRFQGNPVMAAVHRGRDIYAGPRALRAPDLVCEPNPGFDCKAKFDRAEVFGRHGRTGAHTADGAFFFHSRGEQATGPAQAGRLVLDFFGLPPHNAP